MSFTQQSVQQLISRFFSVWPDLLTDILNLKTDAIYKDDRIIHIGFMFILVSISFLFFS
jgi:hypothetical protein